MLSRAAQAVAQFAKRELTGILAVLARDQVIFRSHRTSPAMPDILKELRAALHDHIVHLRQRLQFPIPPDRRRASGLCVVRDPDMRCRMTLEANPEDHAPALSIVEKCCVLSCHDRSTWTAGVPSPGRVVRVQKFQD